MRLLRKVSMTLALPFALGLTSSLALSGSAAAETTKEEATKPDESEAKESTETTEGEAKASSTEGGAESKEGSSEADGADNAETTGDQAGKEGASETTTPEVREENATIPLNVSGDNQYPFMQAQNGLSPANQALLEQLPPFQGVPFDPNLYSYRLDWFVNGGTGNAQGPNAAQAICGFTSVDTPGPVDLNNSYRDQLDQAGRPICCVFDGELGQYRCGDPGLFPNQERVFVQNGNNFALGCYNLDGQQAESFNQDIQYFDGSPLQAGPLCCPLNISVLEQDGVLPDILVNNFQGLGFSEAQAHAQDCAPAVVGANTALSGSGSNVGFTTELFVTGGLNMEREARNNGFSVDMATRLSLLTTIVPGAPDQNTFRATFPRFMGEYRHYFGENPLMPFKVFGQFDLNNMSVNVAKDSAALFGDPDLWVLPVRGTAGVGLGRQYEIDSRITLLKLEAVLLHNGVIAGPIPPKVARQIMEVWWFYRNEIGHNMRLQYTFWVLNEAGLLVGDITPAVVYRFGQIITDPQLSRRLQGFDARLGVRVAKRYFLLNGAVPNGDVTVIVEARDHHVFNLDFDSELRFDPVLAIAPRDEDRADNLLLQDEILFPGFRASRFVLHVPVMYRGYLYDGFINKRGFWDVGARVSMAYRTVGFANDDVSAALGGTVGYMHFTSAKRGIRFQLSTDVGVVSNDNFVYSVIAGINFELGSGQAVYVAPDGLGPQLPFEVPIPTFMMPPSPVQ